MGRHCWLYSEAIWNNWALCSYKFQNWHKQLFLGAPITNYPTDSLSGVLLVQNFKGDNDTDARELPIHKTNKVFWKADYKLHLRGGQQRGKRKRRKWNRWAEVCFETDENRPGLIFYRDWFSWGQAKSYPPTPSLPLSSSLMSLILQKYRKRVSMYLFQILHNCYIFFSVVHCPYIYLCNFSSVWSTAFPCRYLFLLGLPPHGDTRPMCQMICCPMMMVMMTKTIPFTKKWYF